MWLIGEVYFTAFKLRNEKHDKRIMKVIYLNPNIGLTSLPKPGFFSMRGHSNTIHYSSTKYWAILDRLTKGLYVSFISFIRFIQFPHEESTCSFYLCNLIVALTSGIYLYVKHSYSCHIILQSPYDVFCFAQVGGSLGFGADLLIKEVPRKYYVSSLPF